MYPQLFGFLDSWMTFLCLGIIAAILLFRKLTSVFHIDNTVYNFYSINALVSIAAGLVFASLFQSFYNFIETGVFKLQGMTFMGGFIGGAATFIIITICSKNPKVKHEFYNIANLAAPCVVIAHAIGRIGCFLAGCCYGKPTDSWLGVDFPGIGKHYPTQLYEAFFLIILFAVMMFLLFKFKKGDILLLLYGYAYSIFRFTIEFLRGDARGAFVFGLSPSQWQSIVLLIVVITLTVVIHNFKNLPFIKNKSSLYEDKNEIYSSVDKSKKDSEQESTTQE